MRSPASARILRVSGSDAPDVVAGGELRNDPAVLGVHGDLGVQGVREQPATRVVEGDAGLVAGGFDAEDEHGRDAAKPEKACLSPGIAV